MGDGEGRRACLAGVSPIVAFGAAGGLWPCCVSRGASSNTAFEVLAMSMMDNILVDTRVSGTSTIDNLLEAIPLPRMVKVRQTFDRPRVVDVEGELVRKLRESGALAKVKPGHRIAVTAGSRGIVSLPLMLKILVSEIKRVGGRPFLF